MFLIYFLTAYQNYRST